MPIRKQTGQPRLVVPKCKRCGKGGATQSGLCMACIAKAVKRGEFDNIIKKYKPTLRS